MNVMKIALACAAAAFLTASVAEVRRAGFPTKPVTMIVPFAAGGAGDILAAASLGARP